MCIICNTRFSHYLYSFVVNSINTLYTAIMNASQNKYMSHIQCAFDEIFCDICISNIYIYNKQITYTELHTIFINVYNDIYNILASSNLNMCQYKLKNDILELTHIIEYNIKNIEYIMSCSHM